MPSASTIDAELGMWKQLWNEKWKEKLVLLQRQHLDTTGKEMNLAEPELKKLQFRHLPNDIVSTFKEMTNDIFPNIAYSLSILAVLPVTSCEAERTISMLRRLKTYSVQLRPGTLHFLVIFTCRFWNSSRANENTGELSLDTYV